LKEAKPILDDNEVKFLESLWEVHKKENEDIILSELESKINSI